MHLNGSLMKRYESAGYWQPMRSCAIRSEAHREELFSFDFANKLHLQQLAESPISQSQVVVVVTACKVVKVNIHWTQLTVKSPDIEQYTVAGQVPIAFVLQLVALCLAKLSGLILGS